MGVLPIKNVFVSKIESLISILREMFVFATYEIKSSIESLPITLMNAGISAISISRLAKRRTSIESLSKYLLVLTIKKDLKLMNLKIGLVFDGQIKLID